MHHDQPINDLHLVVRLSFKAYVAGDPLRDIRVNLVHLDGSATGGTWQEVQNVELVIQPG